MVDEYVALPRSNLNSAVYGGGSMMGGDLGRSAQNDFGPEEQQLMDSLCLSMTEHALQGIS